MEKYKVTQQFMDALISWRDEQNLDVAGNLYVTPVDIASWPSKVKAWRYKPVNSVERNKRLIAIIQWLNGEDVFEVEKPHKFLVRSVVPNSDGDRLNLQLVVERGVIVPNYGWTMGVTAFNSREEAELWTTNGYEVVEIDVDGNEIK